MIRVLVMAPQSGARTALERALAQDPGLVLVDAIDAGHPGVIVLDSGPESHLALPILLEQRPGPNTTPVVALVDELEPDVGARALRAGARAVLPRTASPEQIRAAVRASAAGLASLPAALAIAMFDGKAGDVAVESGDGSLTPREREILALLGEGFVNKQIGVALGISEHTVKTHLAAIYEKLEVSNRAEAVATGLRRGLVML